MKIWTTNKLKLSDDNTEANPRSLLSTHTCIDDVKTWMTGNKRKLNDDNIEANPRSPLYTEVY